MVTRTFSMYSLSDLGVTSSNYSFSGITNTGGFTASATAAPTSVTLEDTDSNTNVFNDGTPENWAASPNQQLLSGTVDGTVFVNEPSNPENQFSVTDSGGNFVGYLYDLHDANSAAFSSLQGYVTDFEIVAGETYSVTLTTGLGNADYSTLITCFTRGTDILTERGRLAIEEIELGDRVITMDHGLQPVRWIGERTVSGLRDFAPICISKGALGNDRTMHVSPNHRMLISDWRAELLFGDTQVLVAAKDLVNGDTIYRDPTEEVCYMHLLFDQHEVVFAEGAPSESFLPSPMSLRAQDAETQDEILNLFPELRHRNVAAVSAARRTLKSYESKCLNDIAQRPH